MKWDAMIMVMLASAAVEAAGAVDDYAIRLKSRTLFPPPASLALPAMAPAEGHLLVQFEAGVFHTGLAKLREVGIAVSGFIPRYAVAVYLERGQSLDGIPGIRWTGRLAASDRLSPTLLHASGIQHVLVEAFRAQGCESIAVQVRKAGGRLIGHPDLQPNAVLVEVQADNLLALAGYEEVSYIWPAPKAMLNGDRVHYCAGAMTDAGPVASYVLRGSGWDGAGANPISLLYHFLNGTADIAGDGEHLEVERALWSWSQHARIDWTETASPGQNRSLDIRWTTSGFDGAGGTLAYAYFPAPPNPETIAGDIYFDEGETWRIGADVDMFTVALHEAGHALGLDHSDDPNAVMAPYYAGPASGLAPDDIAGIQTLYEPVSEGPDAYEPDNSAATAKMLNSGSAQARNILPAGDQDWAVFTLTAVSDVVITTSGSSGDTVLRLYAEALTLLATDDDGGEGAFSRIERSVATGNALPSGTYYVRVEEFGNDAEIAAYRLSLSVVIVASADAYEPDNTTDQAKWILPGEPQVHSISPVGDADYVKFTLAVLSDVVIEVSGANSTKDDTRMWLYGSDVSTIEFNDDGGTGLYSKIDRLARDGDPLGPGTYFVMVDEYGNNSSIAAYTLTLTVIPHGQRMLARNDFDGDGRSDLGCYDPTAIAPGQWYLMTRAGRFSTYRFGAIGTWPVTGDFDGDGLADTGWYDPYGLSVASGTWTFLNSMLGVRSVRFGYPGTVPVVGDFDGDGIDDFGCYDAVGIPGLVPPGSWYLMTSRDGFLTRTFGYPGTVPVVGDFDGDGIDDFGCYDAAGIAGLAPPGSWYLMMSRNGFATETFGYRGTVPVGGL